MGLQFRATSLDWDDYVGRLVIGRIVNGRMRQYDRVAVVHQDGQVYPGKITVLYGYDGLHRVEIAEATAGRPGGGGRHGQGEDRRDPRRPRAPGGPAAHAHRRAHGDDAVQVNVSPLLGPGRALRHLNRQLRERLWKERRSNVAIQVEETDSPDTFRVSGRGELALAILIEMMRREGYELEAGKPADPHPGEGRPDPRADGAPRGRHPRGVHRRGHGEARAPQGADGQDGEPRKRAHAARVPHPGARPDRLPVGVPHHHPRQRAPEPPLRRLGAVARRHPAAGNGALVADRPGRPRPTPSTTSSRAACSFVVAGGAGVRGPDRRRAQPRQRPGRQHHQGEEAHQRRARPPRTRPSASPRRAS